MAKQNKKRFGLLGKNISYSFSRKYFTEKFETENYPNCSYENFDIPIIEEFVNLVQENKKELNGMNVTIPYKEVIIPYLDKLSKKASLIGAVNTIKFTKKGHLKGYNTDYYGFKKALNPLLQSHHKKALILGTGGSSKAVAYALDELKIEYQFVSRVSKNENSIEYNQINKHTFNNFQIIINATPIGTSPNLESCPPLPYQFFSEQHIAFDLIYNPAETTFLKKAKEQGAQTKNGLEMLIFQAEKAWKIWNK